MTSGGSVGQTGKTGISPIPPFGIAVAVAVPVPFSVPVYNNNKPTTRSVSKLKFQPPKKIIGKRKHNLFRSSHHNPNTHSQVCNAGLRMVLEEDDMFLETLKSLNQNPPESQLQTPNPYCSMVVIKDRGRDTDTDSSLSNHRGCRRRPDYDDFSIFPPSNHENLMVSFNDDHPAPQLSTLSSPPSHLNPPPSPSSVSQLPRWWVFALQTLRSTMASIGSYFGCVDGKGRAVWFSGNVGLAVVVVVWWLFVRVRRHWRRKQSVGRLLQIIREKDEKIIQLLNQIAQMNEVLLARHKGMASKLADQ